ncbi:unnamed protein product [Arabidopsis halleri]
MGFLLRSICFIFFLLNFLNTFASPTRHLCRPDQRDALLDFESEFTIRNLDNDYFSSISYPKTKSWEKSSDCCSWDGITCDANSGEVIELDLSCSCFHGILNANSSLFKLQKLRVLNLANNDFKSSMIPTQFNKLMELTRLNLSDSWFSGIIPTELLHLTKLVSLDLYSNSLSAEKSFLSKLVQNLTNLEELYLGLVNISSEIPQNISNLSSLNSLSLDDCNLIGEFPSSLFLIPTIQSINLNGNQDMEGTLPEFNVNNSLVSLDLSWIKLLGNIPYSIKNLKHLNTLKLQFCKFQGKIPSSFGNLTNLSVLDLSDNYFSGTIPSSFGNLFNLTYLDLSSNRFDGQIPSSFVNLKKLTSLRVGSNMLSGNFPLSLLNLTKLTDLSLADNHFKGSLPPNMSLLSNLETFDASDNTFNGTLPSSLFNIPSLTSIVLKNNQLNDILEFGNSSSPSKLERLSLSHNHFRGSIPKSISRLVNLYQLDLSHFNAGMTVDFSIFLQLKGLIDLDLSYLNTTNTVDLSIIFSHLSLLSSLHLSGVHVSTTKMGSVSKLPSRMNELLLSGCGITEFPEFVRNLQHISDLDLSNNKIKGQVPQWVWKLPQLMILNLSTNSFTGLERFSNDFPRPEIIIHNKLVGTLPRSLKSCSSLEVLNVGSNKINDRFPFWLNFLPKLQVLVLRNNKFNGLLYNPHQTFGFPKLQIIDIANNHFTGNLPSHYFADWNMTTRKDFSGFDYIGYGGSYYRDSMFEKKLTQNKLRNKED